MAEANKDRPRSEESGERGSDRGGRDSRGGRTDKKDQANDIIELASKTLKIQSKRYYVDVKENSRGRFIKLVEGLSSGQKNRMNLPMMLVTEFRDKLTDFADLYASLDPGSSSNHDGEDGRIRSDYIRGAGRRIYMDLKENKRGVFLRISMAGQQQSQRATLALPAQGIVDIRNTLTEFLEEFGVEESTHDLPEPQEMKIERKRFYFDCGRNDRGAFLRVSEVTSNYRSSITIPKQGLHKFREILDDVVVKMENMK